MALTTLFESLPFIDPPAPHTALDKARSLIISEVSSSGLDKSIPHPDLPPLRDPRFQTPLMISEDKRVATASNCPSTNPKAKLTAVDLDRYKAIVPPTSSSQLCNDELEAGLRISYAQLSFLRSKQISLTLLNECGKNAWLRGNSDIQALLAQLERDLEAKMKEIDEVNNRRREKQEQVAEEMMMLQRDWKVGVGKVLETEAATEMLRMKGDGIRRQFGK